MKKTTFIFLIFLFIVNTTSAQSTANTLDVVSWNVEWFGDAANGPADNNLQEENVKKILRQINADIYGLVEVVDSSRLRRLTDSLGSQYAYVLSAFSSGNSTGTGPNWLNGQKLAFIYNKNIFTNVSARGMMRTSGPAYTAWASGRFPYMLTADATINGVTKRINFILIHGKAGSTVSDYQRRKEGAQELKDTLATYYANTTNIIIGDYNDALFGTICTGCGTSLSSYDPIVKDSTDDDHYKSITLPLAVDGQSSMTSFPNVVDNHVISNEAVASYILNSASILIDVRNIVADYSNTTSDHYPVFSQYNLNNIVTGISNVPSSVVGVTVSPNPFQRNIFIKASKQLRDVKLQLTDATGKVLREESRKLLLPLSIVDWQIDNLSVGAYYLNIITPEYRTIVKLLRLN